MTRKDMAFYMSAALLILIVGCAMADTGESGEIARRVAGSDIRLQDLQQSSANNQAISAAAAGQSVESCRSFIRVASSVSLRTDTLRKVGEGYHPNECQQACLDSLDFVCVAAQMQLPATCFVTGYRLRNDYASDHYRRTCESGPQCFRRVPGMSAGFSKAMTIPRQYLSNADMYPLFCMAACELQGNTCVGFDLLNVDGRPRCTFMDLRVFPSTSFDLYMRRC